MRLLRLLTAVVGHSEELEGSLDVGYRGHSGKHLLVLSLTGFARLGHRQPDLAVMHNRQSPRM